MPVLCARPNDPYLDGLLVVLDVITVDVMVRSDRLLQLRSDNVARAFSSCTAREDHDTRAGILERGLKQPNGNTQGNASTPERTLVIGNGPGIALHLLKHVGDLEFGLLDGKEESCGGTQGRARGHVRHVRSQPRGEQTEHLLDLLRGILLAAPEHVRLATFGVTKLMYLCLDSGIS